MFPRFLIYIAVPITLLALPVGPANAQPASLTGLVAGCVFSSACEAARPLLGIPGATHVDQPILNRVDSASIAPGGKWAFISRGRHATFVSGLSGLAVSGAGRHLLLADSATRSVFADQTNSRRLANTIPSNLAPSCFKTLSAGSVVPLNGSDPEEWLLVLDASQVPLLYFVPATGGKRR